MYQNYHLHGKGGSCVNTSWPYTSPHGTLLSNICHWESFWKMDAVMAQYPVSLVICVPTYLLLSQNAQLQWLYALVLFILLKPNEKCSSCSKKAYGHICKHWYAISCSVFNTSKNFRNWALRIKNWWITTMRICWSWYMKAFIKYISLYHKDDILIFCTKKKKMAGCEMVFTLENKKEFLKIYWKKAKQAISGEPF